MCFTNLTYPFFRTNVPPSDAPKRCFHIPCCRTDGHFVSMGGGKFVYSKFGHLVDSRKVSCFPSFRVNELVKLQRYSPFGLLIRSKLGERLPPLTFVNQTADGPGDIHTCSVWRYPKCVYSFIMPSENMRKLALGRSFSWKRRLYVDERGSKCEEWFVWYPSVSCASPS